MFIFLIIYFVGVVVSLVCMYTDEKYTWFAGTKSDWTIGEALLHSCTSWVFILCIIIGLIDQRLKLSEINTLLNKPLYSKKPEEEEA